MSKERPHDEGDEQVGNIADGGTSRRRFLKATATGALAATVGLATTGSAAGAGILTPWLSRAGNKIVDPSGNEVILRGVNIADPGRIDSDYRTKRAPAVFDKATDPSEGWHSNIVRVPTTPQDIAARGSDTHPHGDDWGPLLPGQFDERDLAYYFSHYVDPLVELGAQKRVYVMVDYHRHFPVFHQPENEDQIGEYRCGNKSFEDDLGFCGERGVLWHSEEQAEQLDGYTEEYAAELDAELRLYWSFVADRYADRSHVLFDLYHQPTGPYAGDWGSPTKMPGDTNTPPGVDAENAQMYWDMWVERAQPWLDVLRDNAPRNLVTIGTPRWSQYTYWAPTNEFDDPAGNVCYNGHAKTQDNLRPLGKYFGEPATEVPVFFSEFGWKPQSDIDFDINSGNTSDAASEFERLFDSFPVHPIASCFDPIWEPRFFEYEESLDGDWERMVFGDGPAGWWQEYLKEHAGEDLPGGNGTTAVTEAPAVQINPADARLATGQETTVAVVLTSPPEGVAVYDLTVGTGDPAVATITDAHYADSFGMTESPQMASDGSSVRLRASDVEGAVSSGTDGVGLATVTITAESTGTTGLSVSVEALDANDGSAVDPVALGSALSVLAVPTIDDERPRDLDDDGLYSDFNGNGRIDSDDVVTLFENKADAAITDHVSKYDFNDNDRVDYDDVVSLFDSL